MPPLRSGQEHGGCRNGRNVVVVAQFSALQSLAASCQTAEKKKKKNNRLLLIASTFLTNPQFKMQLVPLFPGIKECFINANYGNEK